MSTTGVQVVSLYNALSDVRYPSLSRTDGGSAYQLYGVQEMPDDCRTGRRSFHPVVFRPGEEQIGDCLGTATRPVVDVVYHVIRIRSHSIHIPGCGTISRGYYGLLEIIVSLRRRQPAEFKTPKGTWEICSRIDARCRSFEELKTHNRLQDVYNMFYIPYDSDGLDDIGHKLRDYPRRLRILLVTAADEMKQDVKEMLFVSLGRAGFSLIFDLDPSGLEPSDQPTHTRILQDSLAKCGRSVRCKTLKEMRGLEQELSGLAADVLSGREVLMIQADKEIQEPRRLRRAMEPLLDKLSSSRSAHLCSPLFLSVVTSGGRREDETAMELMTEVEKKWYDEAEEANLSPLQIGSVSFSFVLTDVERAAFERRRHSMPDPSSPFTSHRGCHWRICIARIDKIADTLKRLYNMDELDSSSVMIPGIDGNAFLPWNEVAQFQSVATLLHSDAGRANYNRAQITPESLDDYEETERRQFLMGQELSVDELYLHDQLVRRAGRLGIYAVREEMDELETKLRKMVERVNSFNYGQQPRTVLRILTLRHEPSAGGTTVGLVALWRLRRDFPCLYYSSGDISDRLSSAVERIFEKSRKTVIVLLDNTDNNEAKRFILNHQKNSVVVLLVTSSSELCEQSGETKLMLALKEQDSQSFKTLYETYNLNQAPEQDIEHFLKGNREKNPFLFGLWAFKGDFTKIDGMVRRCLESSNGKQREVVLMCSYLSRYGGRRSLDLCFVSYLLGSLDVRGATDQPTAHFFRALGLSGYLLITDKKQSGLLPPINRVAEEALAQLQNLAGTHPVDQVIQVLTETRPQRHHVEGLLHQMINLLIKYRDHHGVMGASDRYSNFILHIFESVDMDPDLAIMKICKVADVDDNLGARHVYAHGARYFAYKLKNSASAIYLVRKALELSDDPTKNYSSTQVSDGWILSMCAHILFCSMTESLLDSHEELAEMGEQAIILCVLAKKYQKPFDRAIHPYIHEIDLRFLLQRSRYSNLCRSQGDLYFQQLGTDDTARKEHDTLLERLLELEDLEASGGLRERLRQRDAQRLDKVKSWISNLYLSRLDNLSRQSHLTPLSPNVIAQHEQEAAFVWFYCEMIVMWRRRSLPPVASEDDEDDTEQDTYSPRSFWSLGLDIFKLEENDRRMALELLEKQRRHFCFRNYFENVMLLLAQQKSGDVERALEVATQWASQHPKRLLPHFFLYSLHLLSCLRLQERGRGQSSGLGWEQRLQAHQHGCRDARGQQRELEKGGRWRSNAPRFLFCQKGLPSGQNLVFLQPIAHYRAPVDERKKKVFHGHCTASYKITCNAFDAAIGAREEINAPNALHDHDATQKNLKQFLLCLTYTEPIAVIDK